MMPQAIDLLRRLAGGVHPVERATTPAPDGDFSWMLDLARRGRLTTDLPVRVPLGLTPGVDDRVRHELSIAADMAESEGITRAVVLVDDRAFRVDVRTRTVIDAPDAQITAVGDIDGLVVRHADPSPTPAPPTAPPATGPARVVRNASLIDALAAPPSN